MKEDKHRIEEFKHLLPKDLPSFELAPTWAIHCYRDSEIPEMWWWSEGPEYNHARMGYRRVRVDFYLAGLAGAKS